MVPRFIAPRSYGNRAASFVGAQAFQPARSFASVVGSSPITDSGRKHKVVVVGGGSAGLTISNQLLRTGNFASEDIALVDPAEWHHYQPGWTLVGGGLKQKSDLRRRLPEMIDPKVRFYNNQVQGFAPEDNTVSLSTGD
ncbi:hypothetical protein KC315_g15900, partial [Hortaea werneckii]